MKWAVAVALAGWLLVVGFHAMGTYKRHECAAEGRALERDAKYAAGSCLVRDDRGRWVYDWALVGR